MQVVHGVFGLSQSNSLESLSEQLADLIRDLGYQRVALVGHSMGGLLCQNTIKSLIDSRTRDRDLHAGRS